MKGADLFVHNDSPKPIDINGLSIGANECVSIQIKRKYGSLKLPSGVDYLVGLKVKQGTKNYSPGFPSAVNIRAVMEYGATIKHPSGAIIIIPPRPFIHPVMEKYRDQIIGNYRQAIYTVIR